MTWVLAGVAAWLMLAVIIGVLVGRGIRLADRRQPENRVAEPNFVVDPAPATPDAPLTGTRLPVPRPGTTSQQTPSGREHDLT
jgi:hypothetical protein